MTHEEQLELCAKGRHSNINRRLVSDTHWEYTCTVCLKLLGFEYPQGRPRK